MSGCSFMAQSHPSATESLLLLVLPQRFNKTHCKSVIFRPTGRKVEAFLYPLALWRMHARAAKHHAEHAGMEEDGEGYSAGCIPSPFPGPIPQHGSMQSCASCTAVWGLTPGAKGQMFIYPEEVCSLLNVPIGFHSSCASTTASVQEHLGRTALPIIYVLPEPLPTLLSLSCPFWRLAPEAYLAASPFHIIA